MFAETFYCAFDHAARRLIVKLALPAQKKAKKRSATSPSRICSKLATALCAYAEHFDAVSVHVAVPKGHREYASWMRSCLYVGLKLQSSSKSKRLFNDSNVVLLSLKMSTSTKDNVSVAGTDSTCEGWSPSHSDDVMSETSSTDYFLDLSA